MFKPIVHFIDLLSGFDADAFAAAAALLPPVGRNNPLHRSSGGRARRQWKRTRAAGITKRVRH